MVSHYAVSRKGASHIRDGKPCQDAVEIWSGLLDNKPSLIIAMADGHGDSRYDLSEFGSQIAVKKAVQAIKSFAPIFSLKSELFDGLKSTFPKLILKMWRESVIEDIAERDPNFLEDHNNDEEHVFKRYGTTLLVTLVVSAGIFFCQLGDGDIVVVDEDENVEEPITSSSELIGNETHSLTSSDSTRLWRIKTYSIDRPTLVIMGTDGLSNCFENDQFHIFCRSIYRNIMEYGMVKVTDTLPKWLDDASIRGSGDDISLAIAMIDPQKYQMI